MNATFFRYRPAPDHWYRPSHALMVAVNTALAAEQALLVTGEPGTGKSALARSIAEALGLGPPFTFHTRSDHQARDCLYVFDGLKRFYDAQVKDQRAEDPANYVRLQALGEAIEAGEPRVVLVDEIDKASRDFPNDLLHVVDALEFEVRETGKIYKSSPEGRPLLVITSNGERPLPDPFLRRCVFHNIQFPDASLLREIVESQLRLAGHVPGAAHSALVTGAVERFLQIRALPELEKKPATAELLVWLRVLLKAGVDAEHIRSAPHAELFVGALAKTDADLMLLLGA